MLWYKGYKRVLFAVCGKICTLTKKQKQKQNKTKQNNKKQNETKQKQTNKQTNKKESF